MFWLIHTMSASTIAVGSTRITYPAAVVLVPTLAIALFALARNPSSEVLKGALMFAAVGVFEAYSVNCMLTGGCNKFAWLVALMLAVPLVMLGMALVALDREGRLFEQEDGEIGVSLAP